MTTTIAQCTDVAEFLRILHPPGTVFEIRAPNTSNRPDGAYASTYSGYFNDPELAAERIANDVPKFAPAIYVTMRDGLEIEPHLPWDKVITEIVEIAEVEQGDTE